jgi:hypothetical protein
MLKELQPLVEQLRMTRRNLWEVVEGLSIEQLLEKMPGSDWSIKDALAHLAANEALMTDILRSIANGGDANVTEFDSDEINAQQVAEAKDKSLAEGWRELDRNRRELFTLLEHLTPKELERYGTHQYQGMMNVKEFLVVIYSHEETHCREITDQARRFRKASLRHE